MSASKTSPPAQDKAPEDIDNTNPITLADGTPALGSAVGGTIKVDYRTRVPAPNARRRRMLEFPLIIAAGMRNHAERHRLPIPTDAEVDAEVKRLLDDAATRRLDIEKSLVGLVPDFSAPDAATVDRDVEAAAVLRSPWMIWAWLRLLLYTSGPKRMPMWRRLAVACALRMALASVRPCARRVVESFCKDNRAQAWTYLWPGHPPTYRPDNGRWELSAFHKQLKKVLGPGTPCEMWQSINRQMFLELAGEHSTSDRKGGTFKNCPDALTYLVVDGFLIESDLEQRAPRSREHAALIRNESRQRVGYVNYATTGIIYKRVHGYKWMQLSSLKMGGLVVHGKLFPANVNERGATLELIREAFSYWPELKAQHSIYLIGDALYDPDETFAYELIFRWGIHPVFPRAGAIAAHHRYAADNGVPRCHCGAYATIKDAPKFPTPWYRKSRGLAEPGNYLADHRGELIDDARIRWECKKRKTPGDCKFHADTYPRENPRLYTYLPHGGNHERSALRSALLCYRNIVESSFSQFKDMNLAGKGSERPKWAGDDQMDHLAWMTVVTMTGRRLVHHNGLYDQVRAQAATLGLLQAALPTDARGPVFTPAQWHDWEQALKTYAKAPDGWPEIGDDSRSDVHLMLPS